MHPQTMLNDFVIKKIKGSINLQNCFDHIASHMLIYDKLANHNLLSEI